jgi:hypothetical protein
LVSHHGTNYEQDKPIPAAARQDFCRARPCSPSLPNATGCQDAGWAAGSADIPGEFIATPDAPWWAPVLGPWSRGASAFSVSWREVLGERQVAAPLMAQRAAHGALRLAHRRFQPGEGVGIQLAGLRLSGKPQRASQCQLGRETPVLASALVAPAASRPGQDCAVGWRRGRQVAPSGHTSTVGQGFSGWYKMTKRSGTGHSVRCWLDDRLSSDACLRDYYGAIQETPRPGRTADRPPRPRRRTRRDGAGFITGTVLECTGRSNLTAAALAG